MNASIFQPHRIYGRCLCFRYEELKEQTKQELRKNWEQMMEGDLVRFDD